MTVLSPHLPSLDSLELLLAIGRTGSLARAGAERGVSQAAVSMRVRTIESTVGVRLVERGPTGSRLTTEGSLLADWAADIMRAAENMDAGIASLRRGGATQLRVAASLTVAEQLLPGWLTALRGRSPETAVSLTAVNSAAVAGIVLDRQAEMGFIEGPRVPPGLLSRAVGSDVLVLVCAPGTTLARRRRPVDAAELATLPLVEREVGSGTRAALDAALAAVSEETPERSRRRPTPLLEASSTAAVRAAVAAGAGPAVLSSLAVADDLAAGRLAAVPLVGVDLRRELRAVWLRGRRLMGAGRDLLAIASRQAGSPGG